MYRVYGIHKCTNNGHSIYMEDYSLFISYKQNMRPIKRLKKYTWQHICHKHIEFSIQFYMNMNASATWCFSVFS